MPREANRTSDPRPGHVVALPCPDCGEPDVRLTTGGRPRGTNHPCGGGANL